MKILVTPRSFGKENPELFDELEKAGLEVLINNTGAILDEKKMCEMIADCSGIILGVDPLNKNVLDCAPDLKAVSKYGVGLDNIDLDECKKRNIKVSRTTGSNSNAVADYAFALMLGVARRIAYTDRLCRNMEWKKVVGIDVFGKTLGIIGLGAIGKCVARRARGFCMRMMASDPSWDEEFAAEMDIQKASVDNICRNADIISLHCSLTQETRHIIDKAAIEKMRKNAIIINTARGGLIEEEALLKALAENRIFGAGIDVFEKEPPQNPLWYYLDNVILGSHGASSTVEAINLMGKMATENLLADLGLKKD